MSRILKDRVRIGVVGCGFWSQFQIGGWTELPDAEVVCVADRDEARARVRAQQFDIPRWYGSAEELLADVEVDVVDIISDVGTHRPLVEAAAKSGKHVICQKPMAPTLNDAEAMVQACCDAGVRFFIHENYRWQPQIRRVAQLLRSGAIGQPFRAHTAFNTAYPVFVNQPALAQLEQFALTDQGTHQFDIVRFLFGEISSLYSQVQQVSPGIRGEDVATSMMRARSGAVVVTEISFASRLEHEVFPQTLITVEGSEGSIELQDGPEVRVTTRAGTTSEGIDLQRYRWQHPDYRIEPPSIVACNRSFLHHLLGRSAAETTGEDNLRTLRLVFGAYDSAASNQVVQFD